MSDVASYLTQLYGGASSDAGASLLDTLYGIGGNGQAAAIGSPVAALAAAQQNETAQVAAAEKQPAVVTAMAAYTRAVNSGRSLSDLLSDPMVLNVLLTANGMQDQIGNTGLAKQVLLSNLNDPNSLANVLTDTRWKTLAQTYNLQANGVSALQSSSVIAALTKGYAQMTWETSQDAATPGLSDALAFIQQASSITSVDQILGNATVRNVVTVALGIPQQIAFQSLTAQENAIASRLDVTKFQDPSFVQQFAQRFLIENDQQSSTASSTPSLTALAVEAQG